ncbi:hypothetical protein EXIGLDRAFT_622324 [Exidia glandulosa HHB12029]|uniref:Hydrophobin n=1 Tax=Exidia glandulosa HHB12029 TaxID=1314781 RepID=A0A165E5E8_EXIGL|nr:hypothetical protein EXIGLDRAFT_622324 [Exidia glandulosa HHB12029]
MLRVFAVSAYLAVRAVAVSHTTCKDPSVTWYNDDQGLNPCQQYETIRRYCNSGYEVPVLSVNTTGSLCDTQDKQCCCNSIAFALSMLCLNCQQGVGTGHPPQDNGIDAAVGTYQIYLDHCGVGTNQSLPDPVQLAVCRNGPHLKHALYGLFWGKGDWYVVVHAFTSLS